MKKDKKVICNYGGRHECPNGECLCEHATPHKVGEGCKSGNCHLFSGRMIQIECVPIQEKKS